MTSSIKQAINLYQAGELARALEICRQILAGAPDNGTILNLSGLIHYQSGDNERAAGLVARAVRQEPENIYFRCNYSSILEALGRSREAVREMREVLAKKPDFPEGYYNLGISLQNLGRFQEAAEAFSKVINLKPDFCEAYYNLGITFKSLQKFDKAIEAHKKCLACNPQHAEACYNIGMAYQILNHYPQAEEAYRQALGLNPAHADALYNLGIIYFEQKKYSKAEERFRQTLAVRPENVRACNNLGLVLQETDRLEEAAAVFKKAISIEPGYYKSHSNLGNVLQDLERFGEAHAAYRQALACKPDDAKTIYNIGNYYREINQPAQAITWYEKAIALQPDMIDALWNLSCAHLVNGEFVPGWQKYGYRWLTKHAAPLPLPLPEWQGETLVDSGLLVYTEQGIGDSFQFVRYLKWAKEKACRLILACEPQLIELFKSLDGPDLIIPKKDIARHLNTCKAQAPLLNLPGLRQTTIDNIPADVPYLFPAPELLKKHAPVFPEKDERLKIGIVWQGNTSHKNDKNRSCRLAHFSSLFNLPHCSFFSLQKDGQIDKKYRYYLTDLNDHLETFADTAACMAHLDLVISVDTSVAHLAGAMGRPVWTLLPYVPDWRWLLNREDSPWYPSMRLFRQPDRGDWPAVFAKIRQALQDAAAKGGGHGTPEDGVNRRRLSTKSMPDEQPGGEDVLYLGLAEGDHFGWGVCSRNLTRELSRKINIRSLGPEFSPGGRKKLPGTFFQGLTGADFFGLFEGVRGRKNFGYTFFEVELSDQAAANAQKYDLVLAGSTWCRDRMRKKGIRNCDILLQGIDPAVFHPVSEEKDENLFIVFSGGKFELRKGQDLVLKAIKILQERYHDIILVNCWYNDNPRMGDMALSPFINCRPRGGTWEEIMRNIYIDNGLDPGRVKTMPLVPNGRLRDVYQKTDIGIFPNRCEGGTNLVLMEYMACAKPVIASNTSGHQDIITRENSLMLNRLRNIEVTNPATGLTARWQEADIDEIVSRLEYAYHHRAEIKKIGRRAGADMKNFTWENSARKLLEIINN